MNSLLELDKAQFHRIEQALAAMALLPVTERSRKIHLLHALQSEKEELIRCNPAIKLAARLKAA